MPAAANASAADCLTHLQARTCHQWLPDEVRKQAAKLYLEGTNLRRIGRILGVVHQSAANWINAYQIRPRTRLAISVMRSTPTELCYWGTHTAMKDKSETYSVEGENADLRHYLARLARKSRCFSRSLEALLFMRCYMLDS